MSGPSTGIATRFLMPLVAAATSAAALWSWRGFLRETGDFVGPMAIALVTILVSGVVLRSLAIPRLVAILGQVAAALVVVCVLVAHTPLPLGGFWSAISAAGTAARDYSAPIGGDAPPVWPLLVSGGAVLALVFDIVACTLRRVPGAGLALLAAFSVPGGLLEHGPDWRTFVLAAAGFLTLLHLDTRDDQLRWGRSLTAGDPGTALGIDPATSAVTPTGMGARAFDAVRASAVPIGASAIALALAASAVVPTFDARLIGLGSEGGDGDIRIRKPITDMRRDLDQGVDRVMVRMVTDDPDPSHLRIAVLNRFTGEEWSSGDRDVDSDDTASGPMPPPVGLAEGVPRTEYTYQLNITDQLDSTWLPTPFPASTVEANGDWRYDPATMDFLAADDDLSTRGMNYLARGLSLHYGTTGTWFRDAPSGSVGNEVLELPSGVPDIVYHLAETVTDGARNDYERALRLQSWFRRYGGFRYSVEKAPQGTGNQTLAGFLSEDGRVGYCEQFASAMAVMARTLGIPARVAVGFLDPTAIRGGLWEYSSHDLHAWPELYFAGAGWVRFEPTPAGRAHDVPDYSSVPVDPPDEDPTDQPSATSQASASASARPSSRPSNVPEDVPEAAQSATDDGAGAGRWIVIGVAVLLLAGLVTLLLLLGPGWLRSRQRAHRLAGGPEDLWAEVRATAVDLDLPWPADGSPRQQATSLAERLGPESVDARDALDALDRLMVAVERGRYARQGGGVATAERAVGAADAQLVLAALSATATAGARRRAARKPASLRKRG